MTRNVAYMDGRIIMPMLGLTRVLCLVKWCSRPRVCAFSCACRRTTATIRFTTSATVPPSMSSVLRRPADQRSIVPRGSTIRRRSTTSAIAFAWPRWCTASCTCVSCGTSCRVILTFTWPSFDLWPLTLEQAVSRGHRHFADGLRVPRPWPPGI